jgi:VanZ family protein
MEKRNRITPRQIAILIGIAALVLILCFVYGNSMLSKQESAEVSSSVMDAMEGILRPIVEFVTGGPVDDTLLHKVVRKGAHFAEFAALSALLTVLLHLIFGTWRTHAMGYVLFLSLLFGVLDEFLQSFTGRGTSVRDVMLDLCGALLGIACVITLIEIIKRLRRHQKSK